MKPNMAVNVGPIDIGGIVIVIIKEVVLWDTDKNYIFYFRLS